VLDHATTAACSTLAQIVPLVLDAMVASLLLTAHACVVQV
jgi:hypothetical protein